MRQGNGDAILLNWKDFDETDVLPGQELPERGDFEREKNDENGHAFRRNRKG
jgi:hypothetical protein